MSTHNLCFEQKYEKISEFLSENFHFFFFLVVKFSVYLNRLVFVMIFCACICNVLHSRCSPDGIPSEKSKPSKSMIVTYYVRRLMVAEVTGIDFYQGHG